MRSYKSAVTTNVMVYNSDGQATVEPQSELLQKAGLIRPPQDEQTGAWNHVEAVENVTAFAIH